MTSMHTAGHHGGVSKASARGIVVRPARIPWGKAIMVTSRSWLLRVNRSHLPEVLSLVVGLILLGIGSSFFLAAESYERSPTFNTALSWLSADAWGAMMTLTGSLLLIAAMFREKLGLMAMSLAATALVSMFALALAIAAAGPGVPSAAWMWIGCSVMTAFNTIVYATEILEERK